MSLRESQINWQKGVFEESAEPIVQQITNCEDRALIYVDSYRARLIESLEKTFLLLYKKMGDDAFCQLALDYIDVYPSENFSIARFGQRLSQYLREDGKFELAHIAELDWAINHSVEAKTVKILTRADFQTIPEEHWEKVVFELHPSLKIVDNQRVYRKDRQVYYVEMTAQEKNVLKDIQNKKTFGEICSRLNETMSEDEVANYLIQQIARWLDDELITAFAVKETA
ncbi:MAG: putative DNA-binding domain-containing protein [Gammaproteobacteria bacterium]|nr:putative DNA-binding domain-containing protein [Gammaproteobacteria bacterium]